MSYHPKVKVLAGPHIGQPVTVKTKKTEASGMLQAFGHDTINDSDLCGEDMMTGCTSTASTLLPDQIEVQDWQSESPRRSRERVLLAFQNINSKL